MPGDDWSHGMDAWERAARSQADDDAPRVVAINGRKGIWRPKPKSEDEGPRVVEVDGREGLWIPEPRALENDWQRQARLDRMQREADAQERAMLGGLRVADFLEAAAGRPVRRSSPETSITEWLG